MELRTTKYFIQCLLISEKSWVFSSVTEYDKVPLQEFIIHVRIHNLLPPFNNFCVKTSLPIVLNHFTLYEYTSPWWVIKFTDT
jgi:hypothetical protein